MGLPPSHREPTIFNLEYIERVDENLFIFYTSARVKRVAQINRNMVVLRHHKRDLTLINPVCLSPKDEKKLRHLGNVERIIRLSPAHGQAHDRYYLQKFPQCRRWAPALSDDLPCHRLITEDDDAILPACHVFCFTQTLECALVILQDYVGNLLVTSECLQSQRNNPYVNMPVRAKLASQGLMMGEVGISSHWLKQVAPSSSKREALRDDYSRLLRLDFERLIGTSGVMLTEHAKEETVLAVEKTFLVW